jgi:hypothetical protein
VRTTGGPGNIGTALPTGSSSAVEDRPVDGALGRRPQPGEQGDAPIGVEGVRGFLAVSALESLQFAGGVVEAVHPDQRRLLTERGEQCRAMPATMTPVT